MPPVKGQEARPSHLVCNNLTRSDLKYLVTKLQSRRDEHSYLVLRRRGKSTCFIDLARQTCVEFNPSHPSTVSLENVTDDSNNENTCEQFANHQRGNTNLSRNEFNSKSLLRRKFEASVGTIQPLTNILPLSTCPKVQKIETYNKRTEYDHDSQILKDKQKQSEKLSKLYTWR